MHGRAKKCAAKKHIALRVWSCGRFAIRYAYLCMQNADPAPGAAQLPMCNAAPQAARAATACSKFDVQRLFICLPFSIFSWVSIHSTRFIKLILHLFLHAIAELQHDFGHLQCYANLTRRPPPPPARSVRIIVNVLNACCTAAIAFRCAKYLYNHKHIVAILCLRQL